MRFKPGSKSTLLFTSEYKYTRSYKKSYRRKLFSSFVIFILLAVGFYSFNQPKNYPLILPPSVDTNLDKIIARITPRFSTPLEYYLLPASFLPSNFSNFDKSNLKKLFSLNPNKKYRLNSNSSLSYLWEDIMKADPLETTLFVQAVASVIKDTTLNKNTVVSVLLDSEYRPNTISWRIDDKQKIEVKRLIDNVFAAKLIKDLPVISERLVSGTIYSSLIDSALKANLSYTLVDEFVDLLGDRVDFRKDLRFGDGFAILFKQEQYSDGSWGKVIDIQAASLMNKGKLKAVVRIKDANGKYQSYDENGQPIGSTFLQYPVKFSRVSSVFSDSRFHPVLKKSRPHNGVDFAAPIGTPVRTVGDGIVEKAGYYGSAGYMVKISHSKRWSTAYLHLSKIDSLVKPGKKVIKGQVIGAVGTTGLSSGPHLHFSLYDNNKYVDPLKTKLPGIINEKDLASPKIIQASLAPLKKELETIQLALNGNNDRNKKG